MEPPPIDDETIVADHISDEMEQVFWVVRQAYFGCKTNVINSQAKSLFLDVEGMLNNHPPNNVALLLPAAGTENPGKRPTFCSNVSFVQWTTNGKVT